MIRIDSPSFAWRDHGGSVHSATVTLLHDRRSVQCMRRQRSYAISLHVRHALRAVGGKRAIILPTKREVAIHEAAHAVFGILAGYQIQAATIIPGEGRLGHVTSIVRHVGDHSAGFRALCCLAGPIAEVCARMGCLPSDALIVRKINRMVRRVLRQALPVVGGNCGHDACRAINALRSLGLADGGSRGSLRPAARAETAWGLFVVADDWGAILRKLRVAKRETLRILGDPRIWGAIEEVAGPLIRRNVGADRQIRPLVRLHLGEIMLADLVDARAIARLEDV